MINLHKILLFRPLIITYFLIGLLWLVINEFYLFNYKHEHLFCLQINKFSRSNFVDMTQMLTEELMHYKCTTGMTQTYEIIRYLVATTIRFCFKIQLPQYVLFFYTVIEQMNFLPFKVYCHSCAYLMHFSSIFLTILKAK